MASLDTVTYTPPATALGRAVILATLTMATALYAMTVTIANVALPKMQGTLSATQDQIAWVVTFNLVATAVATPMTGWLVARFGRRVGLAEYVLLLAAAYLTPIWLFADWASPLIMLPLVTLPRAGLLVAQLIEGEGRALNDTLVGTARLLVLYGLLFAAGIVLG